MNQHNAQIVRVLAALAGGVLLLCAFTLFRCGAIPEALIGLLGAIAAGLLTALNRSEATPPQEKDSNV